MPGSKENWQETKKNHPDQLDFNELSNFIENMIQIVIFNKKITGEFVEDLRAEVLRKNNYAFNDPKIGTMGHMKNIIAKNCWEAGDSIRKKMIRLFKSDRSEFTLSYDESVTYDENKNTPKGLLSRGKLPLYEDKDIICEEQRSLFDKFMRRLPDEEYKIFMLKVDKRLSLENIADIIGKSYATARRYYRKIIKKLINYYIEMDYNTKAGSIKSIYELH